MIATGLIDLTGEIRTKLRNGTSIEQVCDSYDLTFNALFQLMKNKDKTIKKFTNSSLYIQEKNGKYILRKCNVNYGYYYTLEDAKKVRDYFIFNGWNKRRLDEVCKKVGVTRA